MARFRNPAAIVSTRQTSPTVSQLRCWPMVVGALLLSACGGPVTPLPPGAQMDTLAPGSLGRPLGPDGLPTLQPAMGVNVTPATLFTTNMPGTDARISRAETAISEARRDLDAVLPIILRLAASEEALQILLDERKRLAEQPADLHPTIPANTTPQGLSPLAQTITKPAPAATTAPAQKTAAAPSTITGPVVAGLRIGEHAGRTRLVLDTGAQVKFTTDLDNAEKVLIVELPGLKWTGAKNGRSSSPAIASWTVQDLSNAGGSRLVIALRRNVSIAASDFMVRSPAIPYDRVMIDLKHERAAAPKPAVTPTTPAEANTTAPAATTTVPTVPAATTTVTVTTPATAPTPPATPFTQPPAATPAQSTEVVIEIDAPLPAHGQSNPAPTGEPAAATTAPAAPATPSVHDGALLSGG